jgi:hypothetical protein
MLRVHTVGTIPYALPISGWRADGMRTCSSTAEAAVEVLAAAGDFGRAVREQSVTANRWRRIPRVHTVNGDNPVCAAEGRLTERMASSGAECAGVDEVRLIATNDGPFVQVEGLGMRLLGLIAGSITILDFFECSFERFFRNSVCQLEVEMLA